MRKVNPSGALLISLALMAVVICAALVVALEYAKTQIKIRKSAETPPSAVTSSGPWAARISELDRYAFAVTQRGQDDPAGAGRYIRHQEPGLYVDVVSRSPLFSSLDKLEPVFGYAEFSRPVDAAALSEKEAVVLGQPRRQVRSVSADSYLGWIAVPEDGSGKRYVINSSALTFIPLEGLEAAGLGAFRKLFPDPWARD